MPMARTVRSLIFLPRRVLHRARLEVIEIFGREKRSGKPLTMLCSASSAEQHYLNSLVFDQVDSQRSLGAHWLWNLRKMAEHLPSQPSLMIINVHFRARFLYPIGHSVYVPVWVNGEVSPKPCFRKSNDPLKSDLRRMRRNKLSYRMVSDLASFDDFYNNMYVPLLNNVHGAGAIIRPRSDLRQQFRHKQFELLLVDMDGCAIAGALVKSRPNQLEICPIGLRNGAREYRAFGAMTAIFQFARAEAVARQLDRVICGRSRAFLHDGVLRFKKKLGQRIFEADASGFAITPLRFDPALCSFLVGTPCIHRSAKTLHPVLFRPDMDKGQMTDVVTERKICRHNGLSALIECDPTPEGFESLPQN